MSDSDLQSSQREKRSQSLYKNDVSDDIVMCQEEDVEQPISALALQKSISVDYIKQGSKAGYSPSKGNHKLASGLEQISKIDFVSSLPNLASIREQGNNTPQEQNKTEIGSEKHDMLNKLKSRQTTYSPLRNIRIVSSQDATKESGKALGQHFLSMVRSPADGTDRQNISNSHQVSQAQLLLSQSQHLYPNALSLLTKQVMRSGGQLTRKAVMVKKSVRSRTMAKDGKQLLDASKLAMTYQSPRQYPTKQVDCKETPIQQLDAKTKQNDLHSQQTGQIIEQLKNAARERQQHHLQERTNQTTLANKYQSSIQKRKLDVQTSRDEHQQHANMSPLHGIYDSQQQPSPLTKIVVKSHTASKNQNFYQTSMTPSHSKPSNSSPKRHSPTKRSSMISSRHLTNNSKVAVAIQATDNKSDEEMLEKCLNTPIMDLMEANRVSFGLGSTLQKQCESVTSSDRGAEDYSQILNDQIRLIVSSESEETEDFREHEILYPPLIKSNLPEIDTSNPNVSLKHHNLDSSIASPNENTGADYSQQKQFHQQNANDSPVNSTKKSVMSFYAGMMQHKSWERKEDEHYVSKMADASTQHIGNTPKQSVHNLARSAGREKRKTPLSIKYSNLIAQARLEVSQEDQMMTAMMTKNNGTSTRLHEHALNKRERSMQYQSSAAEQFRNSTNPSPPIEAPKMEQIKKIYQVRQQFMDQIKAKNNHQYRLGQSDLPAATLASAMDSKDQSLSLRYLQPHEKQGTAPAVNQILNQVRQQKLNQDLIRDGTLNLTSASVKDISRQMIKRQKKLQISAKSSGRNIDVSHFLSQRQPTTNHSQSSKKLLSKPLIDFESKKLVASPSHFFRSPNCAATSKDLLSSNSVRSLNSPASQLSSQQSETDFIDPSLIFKQKRQIFDQPGEIAAIGQIDKKTIKQLLTKQRSHLRMLSQADVRGRASIEMNLNPVRPQLLRHASSKLIQPSKQTNKQFHSMSQKVLPIGIQNFQNQPTYPDQSNINLQNLHEAASLREQQHRLKQLIRMQKRQKELLQSGSQNLLINAAQGEIVSFNDSGEPCSFCEYCSSNDETMYKDVRSCGALPQDKSAQEVSSLTDQQVHAVRCSSNGAEGQQQAKRQRKDKKKRRQKRNQMASQSHMLDYDDETGMLRIQTQVLNPRSNSRLNSDIINQFGLNNNYNDDNDRYSIAIDMRTVKDMHDTLKQQQPWQYPISLLPKSVMLNGSQSPLKPRQTHSTLFNQQFYVGEQYSVQSPSKQATTRKRQSQVSMNQQMINHPTSPLRRDRSQAPNLDLAHIEERVPNSKKRKTATRFSPTINRRPNPVNLQRQNSTTSGFFPENELNHSAVSPSAREDAESPLVHHLKTHYLSPKKLITESEHGYQDGSILSYEIMDQERLLKLQSSSVAQARAKAMQNVINEANKSYTPKSLLATSNESSSPKLKVQKVQNRIVHLASHHKHINAEEMKNTQTPFERLAESQKIGDSRRSIERSARPPKILIPSSFIQMIQDNETTSEPKRVNKSNAIKGKEEATQEWQQIPLSQISAQEMHKEPLFKDSIQKGEAVIRSKRRQRLPQIISKDFIDEMAQSPIGTAYLPDFRMESSALCLPNRGSQILDTNPEIQKFRKLDQQEEVQDAQNQRPNKRAERQKGQELPQQQSFDDSQTEGFMRSISEAAGGTIQITSYKRQSQPNVILQEVNGAKNNFADVRKVSIPKTNRVYERKIDVSAPPTFPELLAMPLYDPKDAMEAPTRHEKVGSDQIQAEADSVENDSMQCDAQKMSQSSSQFSKHRRPDSNDIEKMSLHSKLKETGYRVETQFKDASVSVNMASSVSKMLIDQNPLSVHIKSIQKTIKPIVIPLRNGKHNQSQQQTSPSRMNKKVQNLASNAQKKQQQQLRGPSIESGKVEADEMRQDLVDQHQAMQNLQIMGQSVADLQLAQNRDLKVLNEQKVNSYSPLSPTALQSSINYQQLVNQSVNQSTNTQQEEEQSQQFQDLLQISTIQQKIMPRRRLDSQLILNSQYIHEDKKQYQLGGQKNLRCGHQGPSQYKSDLLILQTEKRKTQTNLVQTNIGPEEMIMGEEQLLLIPYDTFSSQEDSCSNQGMEEWGKLAALQSVVQAMPRINVQLIASPNQSLEQVQNKPDEQQQQIIEQRETSLEIANNDESVDQLETSQNLPEYDEAIMAAQNDHKTSNTIHSSSNQPIMKIVVTQKKQKMDPPQQRHRRNPVHRGGIAYVPSMVQGAGSGGMFGSSALINGVPMESATSLTIANIGNQELKGHIPLGRGAIAGRKVKQVNHINQRQNVLGKFVSRPDLSLMTRKNLSPQYMTQQESEILMPKLDKHIEHVTSLRNLNIAQLKPAREGNCSKTRRQE